MSASATAAPRLTIGDADLSPGIVKWEVIERVNDLPTAWVDVSSELLRRSPVDYQSEARIAAVTKVGTIPLFTGIVDAVEPGQDTTRLSFVASMVHLKEARVEGFGIGVGTGTLEVIWSLLRASGVPADRIRIEEFVPGPTEVFEVIVPIEDLDVVQPFSIGDVTFFAVDAPMITPGGLASPEVEAKFASTGVFGRALSIARTLFDAEREGIAAIELALGWIATNSAYSYSIVPPDALRRFRRQWAQARPRPVPVALTRGIATPRRWLHSLAGVPAQPKLPSAALTHLGMLRPPLHSDSGVAEAIASWKRAFESSVSIEQVVALSEAIEFYAAGVSVPSMMTKDDLVALRAVVQGWPDPKRQRAMDGIAQLKESSLMMRLQAALDEDGVPREPADIESLKRVRRARNASVHGRSTQPPDEADVRNAVAFVNRMIVYRLHRLNQAPRLAEESSVLEAVQRVLSDTEAS